VSEFRLRMLMQSAQQLHSLSTMAVRDTWLRTGTHSPSGQIADSVPVNGRFEFM
jgi:hypothetical protein